jgi:hypothetical protein
LASVAHVRARDLQAERMSKSIRSFASQTYVSVIAVVTVLALLTVPICAPLCAVKTCSSNASNEHCHEVPSSGAEGGAHFIAPAKSCGSFDFSAVLVKANEQAIDSEGVRNTSSAKTPGVAPEQSQPVALLNSILSRPRGVRLRLPDSLQLSPVLRV